jgi:hypothetical protein
MNRSELIELWDDMWKEGNWVPSWPDSLAGITAEQAAASPDPGCHSVWQEVVHVIFWRRVTLDLAAGRPRPSDEAIERDEFASPPVASEEAWAETTESLKETHRAIAAIIESETGDTTRARYHLIHDAYHLGRITQIRAMQGTPPRF